MKWDQIRQNKPLEQGLRREAEPEKKGIAFVFSNWVEKDNPQELNKESKQRLEKAVELYNQGLLSYILVCGGEFIEGLTQPVAKMMTTYLIQREIPPEVIIEERHSKDTTSNVRFGKFILGLKELDDLPIYYISSGYHLERIKIIVNGQNKAKPDDAYVSSGHDQLAGAAKINERILQVINRYDPEGQSSLAKYMRLKRNYPIKKQV